MLSGWAVDQPWAALRHCPLATRQTVASTSRRCLVDQELELESRLKPRGHQATWDALRSLLLPYWR